MNLLLKNGRVINPEKNLDDSLDILIIDGIIENIGKNIESSIVENKDLGGKVIAPGFIDMHVHLREPGYEYKEDIESGSSAARHGGFTAVCCMPNTNPVIDCEETVRSIQHKSKNLLNDVYVIAAVTRQNEGKELAPFFELRDAGVVAFSDDAMPVASAEIQRRIMEYFTMFDGVFIQHCEDQNLTKGGVMNEGFTSTALGMTGIPHIAEEIMVNRGIILSEFSNSRYHVAHISTAKSVELVREAKKRGLKVTSEAAPHHFTLSDDAVRSFDTNTKMNPPLRTQKDIEAIIEGLKDGTIDAIATDHAPHAIQEKDVEYVYAPFGIVGLETAVGLAYTNLVEKQHLSINDMVRKFSCNPRRILGLPSLKIAKGETANLTILDIEKVWNVDITKFQSKSKNSPFNGYELKCKPYGVINKNKFEFFID